MTIYIFKNGFVNIILKLSVYRFTLNRQLGSSATLLVLLFSRAPYAIVAVTSATHIPLSTWFTVQEAAKEKLASKHE